MRILVTGATGFIGRALIPVLQREGHTVVVWARSEARARGRLGADIETVPVAGGFAALANALDTCDAVVNLAGESILGGRWTAKRRIVLRNSRVWTTEMLVRALAAAQRRRRVLVSGSAVGYYGDRGETALTEASLPGTGFLARLCQEWEQAARRASQFGARVVLLRIGIVLGRDGGALASMAMPFRLGLGGRLGNGHQYLPWIHLHDLVGVIVAALHDPTFDGPVNCVAPQPVTNGEFTRMLARALHRPAVLPVPALALRATLGAAASVLLDSQHVVPAALRGRKFEFAYPKLEAALADIFGEPAVAIATLQQPADPHGSEAGRRYLSVRRPVYELRAQTRIGAPLDQTFAFFSRAENLGMLTPAAMGFSIHGQPPDIGEDTTIEYRLRVGPVPISWRSRIVSWVPGSRFVDLQEKGPYRSWWHEHSFVADGSSTLMEDRVCYAPPLGLLGRLAHALFIAPTLRRIFQYRADVIRLRFGAS